MGLVLHPNYLGQRIKQACGQPFATLLRDYRLERALVLLRTTERPVTEIAFECWVQDSNYFSTVFLKAFGLSPRTYRRQIGDPKTSVTSATRSS